MEHQSEDLAAERYERTSSGRRHPHVHRSGTDRNPTTGRYRTDAAPPSRGPTPGPMHRYSLTFLERVKGWEPAFPTVQGAMLASVVQRRGDPPVGAVLWFIGGQHGDCGLALGGGMMMGVSPLGYPVLTTIREYRYPYLGWSYRLGQGTRR